MLIKTHTGLKQENPAHIAFGVHYEEFFLPEAFEDKAKIPFPGLVNGKWFVDADTRKRFVQRGTL